VPFLALPHDTSVLVMAGEITVFHDGVPLTPLPGSYLAQLNAKR
jgi:hypothetical protein